MKPSPRLRNGLCGCAVVLCLAPGAHAQVVPAAQPITPFDIKRIVVSATPTPQSSFNVPGSIYTISGRQVSETEPMENLSETLNRVPGIDIQNRQNYAEGLRVTSRGFGSQTSFGVRNVKLYMDGMPLTTPDGTADSEVIDLGDVSRIEVLSGPFSALYGNAAGGVLQVFSKNGPKQPTLEAGIWGGSFGAWRAGLSYGGQARFGRDGNFNYMMNASDFYTSGYRRHGSARRQQFYGKYRIRTDASTSWTLLVDAVNEPNSQDPLGLTAAQYHADPRQAGRGALAFDTRKIFRHVQTGVALNHRINQDNSISVLVYEGTHDVLQYLPFTGSFAASGGGVIDLSRKFGGIDTRWTNKSRIAGMKLTSIAGVDFGYEHQHRKGYVNDFGTIGALRRNENDVAVDVAEYAQAELDPNRRWSLVAGIRHSLESFSVQDLYVTKALASDTGSVSYGHTSLVAGAVYHLTPVTNLFADYGQGFETPTLDQLAYLPGGIAGLNSSLKPAVSQNYETGIKSFVTPETYLKIALFHIHTSDEIVVFSNVNGRTSYANEGNTGRNGV
ncbi:MAG TPA: TonB-dependent receptor, partial [Acetobacteraceae bacterium]|nr:TonB-dependent receptor [Acetobacteraceae bacterium]